MNDRRALARWISRWPWALLALLAGVAVWYTLDFEDDPDPEYPAVVRPTFGRRPSPAYRLAEPGDTLDRVGIYLGAGATVVAAFSLVGALRSGRSGRPWLGALAASLAAVWYAATPGPTFDGWYGWGWRTIINPLAPWGVRTTLAAAGMAVLGVVAWAWSEPGLCARLRERRAGGVLIGAAVLGLVGQFDVPGVEPAGFWPRWAWVGAMALWATALCRAADPPARPVRVGFAGVAAWLALVVLGIDLTWYHRPLERLRTVEPGNIYICAMPTKRGLQVANERHHFKTIINLFPEGKLGPSPRLADELNFAREHGIRYVESSGMAADSDEFLDETLRIARDPSAWPILVHCHACQDRTPAWMGVYRFVVQGRSLREILREIEGHRGYRPKASVILLYNRVLPPRAPEHYAADPDAALLRQCAAGTRDPYEETRAKELAAGALGASGPQRRQ
jgi:hypothetical protein